MMQSASIIVRALLICVDGRTYLGMFAFVCAFCWHMVSHKMLFD